MKLTSRRMAILFGGLALLVTLSIPGSLRGDEWDWTTHFTPNQQIEVPGVVLDANTTYMIRLLPGTTSRQVVQIFTENRMKHLATFQAISETRPRPVEETTFEFMEVPAGNPVPIRSWFYPGRMTGLEFLYSNEQRDKIAAYTDRSPAATQVAAQSPTEDQEALSEGVAIEQTAALEPPAPVIEENQGVEEDFALEPAPAQTSEIPTADSEPIQTAQVLTTDEPVLGRELPATSGALPLLALFGALSTGLGVSVRLARRS
jgi:hypothetical protein